MTDRYCSGSRELDRQEADYRALDETTLKDAGLFDRA